MSLPSRYQKLEVLGDPLEGASPRTFLTLDQVTLEEVVVRIPPGAPPDPSACEAEVARVRGLHDVRLPPLLNAHTDPPMVAHPWVAGATLHELIRLGPLRQDAALYVTWELTGALAAMHAAGLPHGDLHPGNVRITPSGDVRLVASAPAPFHVPDTSHTPDLVRPRYAAPELLDPEPARPSASSDVYSLALIVYQLFTGRPPLPTGTRKGVREDQARLAKALSKVDRLTRRVPAALGKILLSMLPVDRRTRPRSAVDVLLFMERQQIPGTAGSAMGKSARAHLSLLRHRLAEARAQSLQEVRGEERVLELASKLRRLAELGPHTGGLARQELEAGLDEVLWCSHASGPLDALDRRAALLEGFRAADLAEFIVHREVFGSLLRTGWADNPRVASVVGDPGSQAGQPASLLRERLQLDPGDQDATRLLALHGPSSPPDPARGGVELRAHHLAAHGLPAAAMVHLAPVLATRGPEPEVLKIMARLAQQAAGAASGATPPGLSELPSEVIGMPTAPSEVSGSSPGASYVFSPADLLSSVELDEQDEVAESGASAPTLRSRVGGELEEAMVRFTEGQALVRGGIVGRACTIFQDVLGVSVLTRERFHGPICAEARHLVWASLASPRPEAERTDELRLLLELTDLLDLDDLSTVTERMVLRALRAAQDVDGLEEFSEERSGSVQVYQEVLAEAEANHDEARQLRYLVSLGWRLLELGEITPASRAFLRAKGLGAESPAAAQGLEQTYKAGASLAEAGAAFRELQGDLAGGGDPRHTVARLEEYLQRFPSYLPALEASAGLYLQAGDSLAAGRRHLDLARRALARGESEQARNHFREVLRVEPEHDESLLALACLTDTAIDAGGDLIEFKLHLLEAEGLFATALHLARRHSGGPQADPAALARMTGLAERAGLDPTPYRVAQGKSALDRGDPQGARSFFEAALHGAPDQGFTIDIMLAIPGIERVYSQLELLGRKPQGAAPLHPGGA
jgi:tetratricopeptide (TPR) repeat protein